MKISIILMQFRLQEPITQTLLQGLCSYGMCGQFLRALMWLMCSRMSVTPCSKPKGTTSGLCILPGAGGSLFEKQSPGQGGNIPISCSLWLGISLPGACFSPCFLCLPWIECPWRRAHFCAVQSQEAWLHLAF